MYLTADKSRCEECPSGTVSRPGSTAPTDCIPCPQGTKSLNRGTSCSCGKGSGWDWFGFCRTCQESYYKDEEKGTCEICPFEEATFLPLPDGCKCPNSLSWNGTYCEDCSAPTNTSHLCNCFAGTIWNRNTTENGSICEPCPENYMSDDFSLVCSKCPINTVSDEQSVECLTCPKGYSWRNYTCTECPEDHVGNGINCTSCPKDLKPFNGDTCTCQDGLGWEWNPYGGGSCKPCLANFYKDKVQGRCLECPQEATSLLLSDICLCPAGLSWNGLHCVNCNTNTVETTDTVESGVCSCSSGTFWNSEVCQACPENYFSEDFSTECSKCPVYSVSLVGSTECTSCPKGYSWTDYTCTQCPHGHVGNGATCSVCPEGTTTSLDRTICQKSAVDILSVVNTVLIILLTATLVSFMWYELRKKTPKTTVKMTYRANSPTSDDLETDLKNNLGNSTENVSQNDLGYVIENISEKMQAVQED